ncbi:MAG: RecX family transcriptional regulator [Anaerolinea sp.]|nr:RecX family transcriptional regulator [Anaerolinea sp.]
MTEKKITAIQAQKRNPDRVSIDLDGEFAFGLSRIVAAWLKIGDLLSEEKISSLKNSDTTEVAFQKALHLLDYHPRTEKEIRQRLTQKGFELDEIEIVITRLRNANLVQDQQFARMWVENRNEYHPRSQRLMRYELRNKGVSDVLIDNAMADSADDVDLATRAATKHARKLTGSDWLEFRKRLSAFLARRGFSYGTIAPVVQSVWNSVYLDPSANQENEDNENGKSN